MITMPATFKEVFAIADKMTEYQREITKQKGFMQISGTVFEVHDTGQVAIVEEETDKLVMAYFDKKDPKLIFLNKGQKIHVAGTLVVGKWYTLENPVLREGITDAYSRLFNQG